MSTLPVPAGEPLEPEPGSVRAVQTAVMALELNRGRLTQELRQSERPEGPGLAAAGALALISRVSGVRDIGDALRPLAERHPFGILAVGAAAGGLACLALPRLAVGLVVPVLWSEGRQRAHEFLHGWLRNRSRRRPARRA
jgi:hypothetical protein